MKYSIHLEEDIVSILEEIAEKVIPPDTEALTKEERLELAIGALVNSYDSGKEDEQEEVGEPIDADKLRAALKATINPDISSTFKAPEGEAKGDTKQLRSIPEIRQIAPNCEVLKILDSISEEKDHQLYEATEMAIMAVLTSAQVHEWNSEDTKALVAKTIAQVLMARSTAASENAG